ncbi:hypothetical protein [Roseomonas sp. 18066]|uniref:hypothetical protein n=1 Tax=Roseomonas sp. 18066 TaxID=2681412 RepID=UPI00135B245F|nr:hypothetical protein [Roseomonas sp. 18066]
MALTSAERQARFRGRKPDAPIRETIIWGLPAAALSCIATLQHPGDDQEGCRDGIVASAVLAFCDKLRLDQQVVGEISFANEPLCAWLGGADYLLNCLDWREANCEWQQSPDPARGPPPAPPAIGG